MEDWKKLTNTQLVRLMGDAIRAKRLLKNVSQEELSELSGLSRSTIALLETGKGNTSLTSLLSILKALDMINELRAIFTGPQESPALLARAAAKKGKNG